MKRLFLLFFVCFGLWLLPVKGEETLLWPVEGFYNISSGFGMRNAGLHKGIDISGEGIWGTEVKATKRGTVSAVYTDCMHDYGKTKSCGCGGGYGNFVYVLHDDGSEARYAHLKGVAVRYGEEVLQGSILGTVGSTGSSGGFHLHFELRDKNGAPINPMPKGDGRHTYYGSSAPHTEAVLYRYQVGITAKIENGKIVAECTDKREKAGLFIAQYSGDSLVSVEIVRKENASVTLSEKADHAKVMYWTGVIPEEAALELWW